MGASTTGQNHDRIDSASSKLAMAKTASAGANAASDPFEITAGQKMVSAMSGSLLTSLLGMPLQCMAHLVDFTQANLMS
jgi:hypothetical protein